MTRLPSPHESLRTARGMHARALTRLVTAFAGIAVTAGLTWSVQRLAGQHIGLSSAPPTVIRGLAPPSDPRAPAAVLPEPAGRGDPAGTATGPRRAGTRSGPSAGAGSSSAAAPGSSTAPGPSPVAPGPSPAVGRPSPAAGGGADPGESSGGRDD